MSADRRPSTADSAASSGWESICAEPLPGITAATPTQGAHASWGFSSILLNELPFFQIYRSRLGIKILPRLSDTHLGLPIRSVIIASRTPGLDRPPRRLLTLADTHASIRGTFPYSFPDQALFHTVPLPRTVRRSLKSPHAQNILPRRVYQCPVPRRPPSRGRHSGSVKASQASPLARGLRPLPASTAALRWMNHPRYLEHRAAGTIINIPYRTTFSPSLNQVRRGFEI